MKRLSVLLVLLLLSLPAFADQVVQVWTAQDTNVTTTVATQGFRTAQVTIWAASGSPNGTVTIYYVPPNGGQWVTLKTYATPSAAKTFAGPVGTTLALALSGNSTGTVSANVVLK